jgi:hypothetical protein
MFRFANAQALSTRALATLALVALTTLVLTHESPPAFAVTDWEQVGVDIDGEAAGSEAGYSVALSDDGTTLAVGEWRNTGPLGANQGQVRVYEFSGGVWVQKGSDINGEAAGDNFGIAVDLSEDGLTLAVGAPSNDGAGSLAGHVRVFTYASDTWSQLGADLDGESGNDQFGSSVALSANGRTVAIGAPSDRNTADELSSGQVSVYSYSTSWTQVGSRGQIEGESGDLLGHLNAVDISDDGTVVAVGVRLRNNGAVSNTGALEVYALSGGAWAQRGATLYGDSAEDRLGYAVSINGDGTVAAAGAIHNNVGAISNAGELKVFAWDSSSWAQRGVSIDGEGANDLFGHVVAIDDAGNRVAVGTHEHDTAGSNSGRVRVFDFASNSWSQVGSSIDGESAGDNFGISVALSADGGTLAAGAQNDGEAGANAGTVRVYAYPSPSDVDESGATENAGTPGIYLHVAGPVGRLAEGSPVYYGSDRVAITSTYLLTITNVTTNTTSRVLAEGVVDARGNLEARALLPALQPGDYDVVFQGKHRGGAGLRLTARITVGDVSQITVLDRNIPQVW